MDALPEECLEKLIHLERLDVSHNDLSEHSFPQSLQNMSHLVELSANENHISRIPKVVNKLRTLRRLKLTSNGLKSAEGLDQLKRLNLLILDHNLIRNINGNFYTALRRLEYLHCSDNRLSELPCSVRHVRHLKHIDVSNNQLSILPVELFLLPMIDYIDASGNSIAKLPSIPVRRARVRRITSVDLSDNAVVRFPEDILIVTEHLDLRRNNIRIIPDRILRILESDTPHDFVLDGNPLVSPPIEVCESGVR